MGLHRLSDADAPVDEGEFKRVEGKVCRAARLRAGVESSSGRAA